MSLEEKVGQLTLFTSDIDVTGPRMRKNYQEAIRTVRAADVVVLALGEAALMSGETASRADINLPGRQLELAKQLHQLGKPLVVVLMNGRPLPSTGWMKTCFP
jgi:beta-glucosidase